MEKEIYKEVINILNMCRLDNLKYNYTYHYFSRVIRVVDEKDKDNYLVTINLNEDNFREITDLVVTNNNFYGYKLNLNEIELTEIRYLFNLLATKSERKLLTDLKEIANEI